MRFAPLVLAALCLVVLFLGLDRIGFLDVREARDAQVARELIRNREVLTPIFGTEKLMEKPVIAYAPEALAVYLGTGDPVDSRRWRAAVAVALLLLTITFGARHFGTRTGWLAAGVLVTSLGLPLAARTDGTQLLGTLFGWVGCAGFADLLFGRERGRALRLVVTYGALTAALLIAGPLPALWPLGALALHLALARTPDAWRRAQPLAGLAIMAGVALPWYGAMIERYGTFFLAHAPFFPYAVETRGAWFAGPVLAISFFVVGFFPWSALLPGAALHAGTWWRPGSRPLLRIGDAGPELAGAPLERERREEGAVHFLIACLFAGLAPIVVYPGPPLPAALPALPAAALLCARYLDHLFEADAPLARSLTRAVQMLAITGSAGALLLTVMASRVREASPDLRLLGTVLFVSSWLPFMANFAGRRRLAGLLMALPVLAGTPVVALRVLPAMEAYLNTRVVAETMDAVSPPHAALVLVEPAPPSLRLYGHRNFVPTTLPDARFAAVLADASAEDGQTYLAFRPAREHDVARAAGVPIEILLRTPSLVLARARPAAGGG
jgi:4-amino-4-deoxy-L-arabinose transferase-like glycosyltransferase